MRHCNIFRLDNTANDMQRLIGFLILIFAPVATLAHETMSAKNNYPIHEDFRAACRITAPLGRGVLGISNSCRVLRPITDEDKY